MKPLSILSALALVLALASSAVAQETAKPKPEAFPVGTKPKVQIGQTYTADTFDSWEMLCVKVAKGPEPCEIGQLVLDDKSNPISDVRFFPLPPGTVAIAGATIVTPLGVLLKNGVVIGVDDAKPKQYPYSYCNNVGCIAQVGFTGLELQALRKGKTAKITVVMANNRQNPLIIPVSLKGFAPAYAALSKYILDQQKAKK